MRSRWSDESIYQAANWHAQSEKSRGDKALIHVASPERGLYQVLAFGLSRGAQESGIGG
jgi:hypothetical protein